MGRKCSAHIPLNHLFIVSSKRAASTCSMKKRIRSIVSKVVMAFLTALYMFNYGGVVMAPFRRTQHLYSGVKENGLLLLDIIIF